MTTRCQFVSDLHGRPDRYEMERPEAATRELL